MANPLYAKLYSAPFFAKFPVGFIYVLKWRASIFITTPPREAWDRPSLGDYAIYTDSAPMEIEGSESVIYGPPKCPDSDSIKDEYLIQSRATPHIVDSFKDTSPIFRSELIEDVVTIFQYRYLFTDGDLTIFVFNAVLWG